MTKNKNIFLIVFEWVVNCYNHSFFEKIMSKIFGFFSKSSQNSRIIGFFRNRFLNGNQWNKSLAAKVIRSPFALCRKFYYSNCDKIESIKKNSSVLRLLSTAGRISLRDYGIVLLSMGTGMLFGIAVFMKWESMVHMAAVIVVFALGMYLSMTQNSYSNIARGSGILKRIKQTISYYNDDIEETNIEGLPALRVASVLGLVLGFVLYSVEPVGAVLGTVAAITILLILWKTKIGVFLFVPLSAILPTMALVGIIGITFVSFILHLLFSKDAEYVSTPFQPLIALFLGLVVYAALTSVALMSSLKILMVYIVFTLAYVLVINTIKKRSDWAALVILLVLAAVLVALYGIYQNFFMTATTQSWVDEEMFSEIEKRVYSTLDNPNVLGQYFIMMMPIAFALFIKMQGSFQKVFYATCNFVMFACLMYTWSRGAWLGVVIGIGFFVLLKDRRWLAVCIAGLLIMPSVLPASILQRLTSIGNLNDSSTSYRVAVWIGSLRLLKNYWFTGIGLGPDAFLEIYPQYALGGAGFALHSHNFYLQWVVDMGFLGLITYFAIIIGGFKQIASVKEKSSLIKNVLLAMTGGLFGYLFHGMAENLWYNYRMILVFWAYFGILQSGVMIANKEE